MIGETLSHYKILDKLGSGGMGEVFLAQDLDLDRKVALKVLPGEMAENPERLERFRREAKAVAALSHPNIVTIHSIEESDGHRFLTMELVDGESLDKLVGREGLPLERVFEIAIPLADALAAAHEKGIIHRDLKPANVMSTRDGRIKILDFGLAKLAVDDSVEADDAVETQVATRTPTLTGEGIVMGTAPYMSPEQLQGKAVDQRSDIFSLGVLLYEMITGSRPFQGESGIALASAILKDTPTTVTEAKAELPRHLGRIVHRCLEKDPRSRYQSALDVYNELKGLREEVKSGEVTSIGSAALPMPAVPTPSAGVPVPPIPTSGSAAVSQRPSGGMVVEGPRRGPWIVIAVAGVLVAAVLGWFLLRGKGSDVVSQPISTDVAESTSTGNDGRQMIVVLPFENLGPAEDEYFADGMSEEITSRLAAVGGLGVISRSSARQYKENRPPVQQIGQELGVDFVLEGTVRWERSDDGSSRIRVTPQLIRVADDTSVWSDRYDRELEQIFEVQSEIAETVTQAVGVTLVDSERQALSARMTENVDAYQAYLRGLENFHHPDFSEESLGTAVSMFRRATELDSEFGQAWGMLSYAISRYNWFLGEFQSDWVPEARNAAERALSINSQLPEGKLALGFVHYYGERDYQAALEVFQDLGRDRPNDSDVAASIAFVLRRLGRIEEAVGYLEKSIELNPKNADRLVELSNTYGRLRRYDEALEAIDRAIAMIPDQVGAYTGKMQIFYSRDGDLEAARQVMEKIPNQEGEFALFARAGQLILENRYDEALLLLERSPLKEFGNATGSYFPKVLLQAHLHRLNGDAELAKANAEHAISLLEPFVQSNPESAFSHGYLGEAYALAGRSAEAVRMAQEAVDLFPLEEDAMYGGQMLLEQCFVLTLAGRTEEAIDTIEQVLSIPAPASVHDFLIEPRYQPLHDHPRFQALVEKHTG